MSNEEDEENHGETSQQWARGNHLQHKRPEQAQHSTERARELLDGMRKKRASLEELTGHSFHHSQQFDRSRGSSSTKLWTVDEQHETTDEVEGADNTHELRETDRARDILELMKKRRENFSKLLIASPTSTKHSLTRTESTEAISWVSSSSDGSSSEDDHEVAFIYSDEDASNSHVDYTYLESDVGTSSCTASSVTGDSLATFFSGYGSASGSSRSLLSDLSVDIRNYDMRYTNIPNPLTAVPLNLELSCPETRQVLERKTPRTSRARGLYHERSTKKLKSYQYLKSENSGHGTETSRLRADLAAISERRSVLADMLDSVQQQKSQEIDFSVVASTILSASSSPSQMSPDLIARKEMDPIMARLQMAKSAHDSRTSRTKTVPVEFVDFGHDDRWSASDARAEELIEPFGFPLSDTKWAGSDDFSESLDSSDSGDIEWDAEKTLESLVREESVRGSIYFSGASSTETSEASLPVQIEFRVKTTPLSEAAIEPPKALRSAEYLKALYSPRPEEAIQSVQESKYGGIYQIAQRTQDVELLTDRKLGTRRRRRLAEDDFNIPYNVEDRFAGGLYHIASQTKPTPNRAMI